MPFIAELPNGKAVTPKDFEKQFDRESDLYCPFCEGSVGYRKESIDGKRAHFWHINSTDDSQVGGCSTGGESPEHEWMKQKAIDLQSYQGEILLETGVDNRIADILIEFPTSVNGCEGVVIEVQYKNKNKNYIEVTEDFTRNGYAIHWVFATKDELYKAKKKLQYHTNSNIHLGYLNPENIIEYQNGTIGNPIHPDEFEYDYSGKISIDDSGNVDYTLEKNKRSWINWKKQTEHENNKEIPYSALIHVAYSWDLITKDELPKYHGEFIPKIAYDATLIIIEKFYRLNHGREYIQPNNNTSKRFANDALRKHMRREKDDEQKRFFEKMISFFK